MYKTKQRKSSQTDFGTKGSPISNVLKSSQYASVCEVDYTSHEEIEQTLVSIEIPAPLEQPPVGLPAIRTLGTSDLLDATDTT